MQSIGELACTERVQLCTTNRFATRQAGLIGNRSRRGWRITADHHHPHACGLGACDGSRHLRPDRIGKPDQTDGLKQIVMGLRGRLVLVPLVEFGMKRGTIEPRRHRKHPQPLSSQFIRSLQ